MAVLLLCCQSPLAHTAEQDATKLLEDAKRQQQKLLETYGLSRSSQWQHKCNDMVVELKLLQFQQCLIIQADFANAYSLAHGTVILTEGLLHQINNDHQLAHVLAHEHAHLSLKHHQQAQQMVKNPPKLFTKSRIKKFYRRIEQQADQAADEWLLSAKFDPLQIHHYLLRIEQISKEHSNDHQKLKHRIQRDGLPEEVMDDFWRNH